MAEKTRKQKLKEKRCRMHVIHTCEKYGIGYQMYCTGTFQVTDFKNGSFKFSEQAGHKWSQSIFELRDKLDVYIKHNKTSHL